MDKQDIFKQVAQVEEQLGELYLEIGALKKKIIVLIEENKNLTIENHHLRERINQEFANDYNKSNNSKKTEIPMGEGYDNLARLYQEGFHVCNVNYGSLRTEGDCLLCLNFLRLRDSDQASD